MSDYEPWTVASLKRLRLALAKAKADKKDIFKFDGNDLYVPHVEPLVKVLELRFKNRKE